MAATRKKTSSTPSGSHDGGRTEATAEEPPPQPSPERKRPVFLIVSSVLLAAWLTFLAAMAFISTRGDSLP